MLIQSPEKMFEAGKNFSRSHKKILLHGELAAGKTTFTQGFAHGLKLSHTEIQSPTYTYMHEYEKKLLHIDMYRIETMTEIIEKGILEKIESFEYIIIERPKHEHLYITDEWLTLYIEKISPAERKIII